MSQFLKQSTTATLVLGPFVDDTDGKTAETGLTISRADVRLSKNAGTFAQKGESTSCTHMENGYYSCPVNTTDTGTLGILTVAVAEAGALPVWQSFMVMSATAYDALMSTGLFNVNVTQISGDGTAADNAESYFDGTGYAGTNNVIPLVTTTTTATNLTNAATAGDFTATQKASITTAATSSLNTYDPPTRAELTSDVSTLATAASISALNNVSTAQVNAEVDAALADIHLDHLFANTYDPASKPGASDSWANEIVESDSGVTRFTANALEEAPSGTGASAASIVEAMFTVDTGETEGDAVAGSVVYEIVQNAGGGSAPSAADIRAEIDSNSTQLAAIVADTNELQADWVNGGRLDTILDARASQTSVDDVPTNSELTTALSGLATASALATVDNNVDDILTDTGTTIPAQISALNNISTAQVNAEVDSALADYDGPTNTEMVARTLPAADYATDADLAAVAGVVADVDSNVDTLTDGVIVSSIGNTALDSILNRQMTESYAADGAAPTIAQALIALVQMHTDHDLTTNTWVVRKLDGTTVAFTLTIDDPDDTTQVRRTG